MVIILACLKRMTLFRVMSAVMDDPVSHGKDPNAMAAGVPYGVCLAQGEEVRQAQITEAANLSVVTIRKRLQRQKGIS